MREELSHLTIEELLEELSERCVGLVAGMCVPENNVECETRTFRAGNRVTQLGLSTVLCRIIEAELLS